MERSISNGVVSEGTSGGGAVDATDATFDEVTAGAVTVIDFWAPWCGPCKKLHPMFEEVASSSDSGVVFARVNVDDSPAVALRFGVMSIPSLVVLDNTGAEAARIVGLPDRRRLDQLVAEATALTSAV